MAFRHWVGVGDADRQLVLQQHPPAALQRAEHTALLPLPITGLHTAEVGAVSVALAGVAAKAERLQVLMSSDPPWFLGMMWFTSRAR